MAPLARGAARKGEVQAKVGRAGGPQGAQRLPQVPPAEALPRQRLPGDGVGHHPLGEVEALPEVRPGVHQRAPAHPEVVEGVRGGLPVPPATGRAGGTPVLEVGAARGDRRRRSRPRPPAGRGGSPGASRPRPDSEGSSRASPGARPGSATPAPGRRRGPSTRTGAGVGRRAGPRPAVVGPEAAPQREVVGALDHVDGIDLESPDVLHEGEQGGGGEPPGPRPREVLAGQEEGGHGAAADDGSGHDRVAAILPRRTGVQSRSTISHLTSIVRTLVRRKPTLNRPTLDPRPSTDQG